MSTSDDPLARNSVLAPAEAAAHGRRRRLRESGRNVLNERLYILAGTTAGFAPLDRSRTQLLPHADPAHVRPAAR